MSQDLETRTLRPEDATAATGLLAHLNPDLPGDTLRERYEAILRDHPHYFPFGVFRGDKLVGLTGAWIATKVWCGRYLEVDNLVVHPDHRSEGIGTILIRALEELAAKRECELLVLDSYTSNYASHRLYHRLGYEIRGFHFVKPMPGFQH